MRFKVLCATHSHGRKKGQAIYKEGDVIEADEPLDEMFVNKFQRLPDDEPAKRGKKPVKEEVSDPAWEPEAPPTPAVEPVADPRGEDVTADFQAAAAAEVGVFKDGKDYDVYDRDGDKLTKASLKKSGVRNFLEKLIADEDTDATGE